MDEMILMLALTEETDDFVDNSNNIIDTEYAFYKDAMTLDAVMRLERILN